MIIEVEGIVLSQQDYKEKDVLLQVATKDYGQITLLGKSLRAIASKNAGACLPLMQTKFMIDHQELKTIHILTNCTLVESFRYIREDLYKQAFGTCMAECCSYLLKLNQEEGAYDELVVALSSLNLSDAPKLCFGLYLARLCRFFGIEPFVDGCVVCGSSSGICSVSVVDGGFVCDDCYEYTMKKQPVEFLRLFRILMKANYEHLPKIAASEEIATEVIVFLLDFIREHTSFTARSEKFIVDILHI